MAKEILAIPEENVLEVVSVIRIGLAHDPDVSPETVENLLEWCISMEDYINGI